MGAENKNRVLEELAALERALRGQGDEPLAEKAASLADKGREDALYIAFCGHFSAGKSSLINHLCGARLLPSSPIPTSANIVAIKSGETSEAVLTYRDGREARVSLDEVTRFAKEGETVRSVELRHPIALLGERGVLLDTPGVDSTDDNHRQSTESALHLADIVVYVMDYNHVLSEMNMDFAKRLSGMGKPLILVVNQIDKHREEEVSFEDFQAGVADAFRSWGVKPAACLYTTLKEPDHPWNESHRLRALLAAAVRQGSELALAGLASAAVELAEEGGRAVRGRNEERRGALERLAAAEDEGAAARYEALQAELAARASVRERLADRLKAEAASIAENANLTPATTRDLAHRFLESRQPNFRVGLLFAAAKTEEERRRRLAAFREEFAEHVEARLVWHVRDAVQKAGRELGLADAAVEAAAAAVDIAVTPEWLAGKVRPGAVVSGEYTLNYAKEIAGDVRQEARRAAARAAELLADAAEAMYAQDNRALEEEAEALAEKLSHRRELAALEAQEREARERLLALLPTARALASEGVRLPDASLLPNAPQESGAAPAAAPTAPRSAALDLSQAAASGAAAGGASAGEPAARAAGLDLTAGFAAAAALLEEASRAAAALPALQDAADALLEKAGRLREQRFTAALFGAFSAGKSSFANALLGEPALPVSPNPTTAAINTIQPPTPEWPHGTARVTMKSREAMIDGLRHSLAALGDEPPANADAPALLKRIAALLRTRDDVPPGGKPHLAFLKAASEGWSDAEPTLGTEVRADRDAFRAFVAEERKSAFVERIELYYESALSRQGVTLVDTPGADSVNARHTGVAFNYMKNADAIFFVTYYNHAFSRADRQFLEQLGRVKDAFELDKMFFIVNAADLAASEEELNDVLEHVRSNLLAFGIRHPRLFPVSSLQALQAKLAGDAAAVARSGLAGFEEQFARFARVELSSLAYRAAGAELARAAQLAATALEGAKAGETERQAAMERLSASEAAATEALRAIELDAVRKDAWKEANEQLYYVKQRFQFRFGDWYQASFNPSALREDRGNVKEALAFAWRDLVAYVQTELTNEALAVSLRLERFLNRSLGDAVTRWNDSIKRAAPAYEPPAWEDFPIATPDVGTVWDGESPDAKLLAAHYKSAKQFFEGDGRKALREALERRWQPSVAQAVDALSDRFASWIDEELRRLHPALNERLERAIAQSIRNARASWERPVDPAAAERTWRQLQGLQARFEDASRIRQ
ncbi:dynamin family protein [Paenibacillus sp.]|uniref:dynamin family protein n=1 Tax=Paenibacillus sp. TaxID=58172 RepID=UPI002D3A4996|nr:dynamin family protein [Paenibacillus sp.]HZG85317.1 dynamin family protein [Paenibacillus sp.]